MALTRITLSSGRTVRMTALRLSSTYGGMLEGYPFARWNDRVVDRAVRGAGDAFPGTPVHLVEPLRDRPDMPPGAFGPVEKLPAVTCVGTFRSAAIDPAHDPVLHRSALTVVWFRATPDVPSDENTDPALLAVPWEEAARDFEL
ncbi:hypothetical protein [Streptomyces sp. NPDC059466]|uniref:hypothetical protein n=1 Tax=unclassified Streptomyces TaxID=2593676 RepID=UPI0036C24A85